jgi:hypothetical protein
VGRYILPPRRIGTEEVLGDRGATRWPKREVEAGFGDGQTYYPALTANRPAGIQPDWTGVKSRVSL